MGVILEVAIISIITTAVAIILSMCKRVKKVQSVCCNIDFKTPRVELNAEEERARPIAILT